jgi:DNA topoisomerase VI subunit B
MSKKTKSASSSTIGKGKGKGDEQVTSQSAAEFFSEHQQIAGYDNPGKSLFTTIREFIENSLDAAESIRCTILCFVILEYVDMYKLFGLIL